MRNVLILGLMAGLVMGCSDEPEQKTDREHAGEHTLEQSAEYAESAMDAAGEETEVVVEDQGDASTTPAESDSTAADAAAADAAAAGAKGNGEAQAEAAESSEVAGRDPAQIYEQYCGVCHAQGVAGAPKLDDTAAWQKRLEARGRDTLVQNALNGYKAMPAKGTCSDCSEAEMAATVDYMLSEAGL